MDNRWAASFQALKANVTVTVLSRYLLIGLNFITSIITARSLGPEGRGEYVFVTTLAAIIAQFGNLGLHASNTYLVAREASFLGGLLANSFWVSLLVGGLAVSTVFFTQVFHFFPGIPGWQLWMAAALAPLMLFYMLGVNLLVGINRIKAFNCFEIANRLALFIALVIAALMVGKAFDFLTGIIIATLIIVTVLIIYLYRRHGAGFRFNKTIFTMGFHYALKAYLVALFGFLISQSCIMLLRQLSGSMEVGYYSIGFNIGNILGILPTSMALVLFPRLVKEKAQEGREITLGNTALVGGVMIAFCLVTAFLAKPMVTILYGSQFKPAVPVLYWILPGIFFSSMVSILSQYLAAAGFPWILVGVWAIGFLLVTGLSFLLIPICHGGIGVAISVSITQVFLFVSHFVLVRFGKFHTA